VMTIMRNRCTHRGWTRQILQCTILLLDYSLSHETSITYRWIIIMLMYIDTLRKIILHQVWGVCLDWTCLMSFVLVTSTTDLRRHQMHWKRGTVIFYTILYPDSIQIQKCFSKDFLCNLSCARNTQDNSRVCSSLSKLSKSFDSILRDRRINSYKGS
jgi:hypothetical protein